MFTLSEKMKFTVFIFLISYLFSYAQVNNAAGEVEYEYELDDFNSSNKLQYIPEADISTNNQEEVEYEYETEVLTYTNRSLNKVEAEFEYEYENEGDSRPVVASMDDELEYEYEYVYDEDKKPATSKSSAEEEFEYEYEGDNKAPAIEAPVKKVIPPVKVKEEKLEEANKGGIKRITKTTVVKQDAIEKVEDVVKPVSTNNSSIKKTVIRTTKESTNKTNVNVEDVSEESTITPVIINKKAIAPADNTENNTNPFDKLSQPEAHEMWNKVHAKSKAPVIENKPSTIKVNPFDKASQPEAYDMWEKVNAKKTTINEVKTTNTQVSKPKVSISNEELQSVAKKYESLGYKVIVK